MQSRIYLFIYLCIVWRLVQGHLRAFHEIKFTQVEYNTKQAYFTNVKYMNIIQKLVTSVLLSKKKGK